MIKTSWNKSSSFEAMVQIFEWDCWLYIYFDAITVLFKDSPGCSEFTLSQVWLGVQFLGNVTREEYFLWIASFLLLFVSYCI